jgi:hypothetical protein
MLFHSRSGKRSKTLPRRFTRMPSRCHALNRRLAVNTETLASFANSSLLMSSSTPPGTLWPIPSAR